MTLLLNEQVKRRIRNPWLLHLAEVNLHSGVLEPLLCPSEPWREGPSEARTTVGQGCTEWVPSPGSWALNELGRLDYLSSPTTFMLNVA